MSPTCRYDHLEIRDGTDYHGRLIGRYCGPTAVTNLTAMDNVWIKLKTDRSGGSRFRAHFIRCKHDTMNSYEFTYELDKYLHSNFLANCIWLFSRSVTMFLFTCNLDSLLSTFQLTTNRSKVPKVISRHQAILFAIIQTHRSHGESKWRPTSASSLPFKLLSWKITVVLMTTSKQVFCSLLYLLNALCVPSWTYVHVS